LRRQSPAFGLPRALRAPQSRKISQKWAHQIAGIAQSRATIGFAWNKITRFCLVRIISFGCAFVSAISVDEPDAVNPGPGAALNAFADPGRTRRVDSSIFFAVGLRIDFF
jgi:hypothetical protein